MVIRYVSLLFLICCVAGCGKRIKKEAQIPSDTEKAYRGQEAKMNKLANATTIGHQKEIDTDAIELDQVNYDYVWTVDIPIPVAAVEKSNYHEAKPDVYATGYCTSEKQGNLVSFYQQQMELLGWHCWWSTQGLEALMMFEKPHKQCAISLRPASRKKTDIIIMQKTV